MAPPSELRSSSETKKWDNFALKENGGQAPPNEKTDISRMASQFCISMQPCESIIWSSRAQPSPKNRTTTRCLLVSKEIWLACFAPCFLVGCGKPNNILYRTFPHFYHWLHHIAPILFHGWNPHKPQKIPNLHLGKFEYFTNLNSGHLEMISLILPWFQGEQWGRYNLPSHWLQRPRAAAFALLVTEVHEFHHQTLVQREKGTG